MIAAQAIIDAFQQHYGTLPALIGRAPGRVNLIGEHTDYNEGWVLPVAIDLDAAVAARPRTDRTLQLYAHDLETEATLNLDSISQEVGGWTSYTRGMAALLQEAGYQLKGADLVVMGDVPRASGLSSSAALEVAMGTTLTALSGQTVPGVELAQLSQRTENNWVGVNSGIMDQMISALGKRDHALLIDCRDYSTQAIPIPSNVRIMVCDSKKSRELAHSAYNERRAQCEEAVRLLQSVLPGIRALRDVRPDELEAHADLLPPIILQRARHIVTEDARVLDSVKALRASDLATFGHLMNESHRSLRDDYEVSSKELDTLVEAAQQVPGTYGSRLTGAGFGGCTVSLVVPEAVDRFKERVAAAYRQVVGYEPEIYVCVAADGASAARL
ncbi:MAG: galactokinase [Herpetosiphonaceae bacterium]|nr:galactokinase [Herpetosiphonaceae bacterium]